MAKANPDNGFGICCGNSYSNLTPSHKPSFNVAEAEFHPQANVEEVLKK